MNEWLKQAQNGNKGMLNFGAVASPLNTTGGVNYVSSTAGSQVYAASSLVSR